MGKSFNQPNKHINGSDNPHWKGGKVQKKCLICSRTFETWRPERSQYCSKPCFYKRHPHLPIKDLRGYISIWKNGKYRKQHRLVMEEKLGRPLKKEEVVHHINKIKYDNRPENLEIFSNQSAHMTHHHRGPR